MAVWVSRDGTWRVEQIPRWRGGATVMILRVSRSGEHVGEARTVDQLAALGVPVDDLAQEYRGQTAAPPSE